MSLPVGDDHEVFQESVRVDRRHELRERPSGLDPLVFRVFARTSCKESCPSGRIVAVVVDIACLPFLAMVCNSLQSDNFTTSEMQGT